MTEEQGYYYKLSDEDIRAAIKMYIERQAGVTLDVSVSTTLRYDPHRFMFAAEVAVTPPPASASPPPVR